MKLKCKTLVMLPSRIQNGTPKTIWAETMIELDGIEGIRKPVEGEQIDPKKHCLITVSGVTSIVNLSFDEMCAAKTAPEEKILVQTEEEKETPILTLGKGGEA
jgi:hypothetical protein